MKRAVLTTVICLVASAALVTLAERSAQACGACFAPSSAVTAVDSHRMVIALGTEETVLWDQIVYSGAPEEFVWVLPVPSPEVTVEVADPSFFDMLDIGTAPSVSPFNPLQTGCGSSGLSCTGGDDYPGSPPSDGVTVYNEGTVGPYETVTVGAKSRNGLYDWLTANGYEVTPASLPIIEHYLDLGHVFVALRLRPGVGVQAMQPVRVRYPGFMGSFPLKGVIVGARGVIKLSLWIIAEQRYEASNYPTVRVNTIDLVWDWETNTSNYQEVFDQAILDAGGRAWVVEYANTLDQIPIVGSPTEDLAIARASGPAPFVTRLRTNLRIEHINEDLQLAPSSDSIYLPTFLIAGGEINRPDDPDCNDGCATASSHATGLSMLFLMLIGGLVAMRRRRNK